MTKLILIEAIDLSSMRETTFPPLGLAYLASYLAKYMNFYDTAIIENPKQTLEELVKHKPNIVGISSVTQNFDRATALTTEIEFKFDIPVTIGGTHITALPHTLPCHFDIGVLSEGEETMSELMQSYEKDGLDKSRLVNVEATIVSSQN